MTQPYERVKTSADVFNAILENHKGSTDYIILFSSYGPTQSVDIKSSVVYTRRLSYGFPGATVPLIETDKIFHRPDKDTSRVTHIYYLCYPIEDNS
jgi:hypothetical protein